MKAAATFVAALVFTLTLSSCVVHQPYASPGPVQGAHHLHAHVHPHSRGAHHHHPHIHPHYAAPNHHHAY
jgi:hypothetical protein